MAGKRGRKAEKSNPVARLFIPRIEQLGMSITGVETELGLPRDSIRNLMRGKLGRNRRNKIELLTRVASFLNIPPESVVAMLNNEIPAVKDWDFGTDQSQVKRVMLAAGGNPSMCGTALGVLAARGEVYGLWGISHSLYFAGQRFGEFFDCFSNITGAPRRPDSILASLLEDEIPEDIDQSLEITDIDREKIDEVRSDIFRLSAGILKKADQNWDMSFKPSVEVMRFAVSNELPGYVTQSQETQRSREQFCALVYGLSELRRFYNSREFSSHYKQLRS